MKKTVLFTTLQIVVLCFKSYAQDYICNYQSEEVLAPYGSSENGYAHSPNGNLHMMLLFVTFIEDDNIAGADELSANWPKNSVPVYTSINGQPNPFMDANPLNPTTQNNLTNWFKTMSKIPNTNTSPPTGKFSITGEVFQVQISKETTNIPDNPNISKRIDEIEGAFCQRAIAALQFKYPNEDWSRFDNRHNNPNFSFDNFLQNSTNPSHIPISGDGIIDYLNICFRLPKSFISSYSTRAGYAGLTFFSVGAATLSPITNAYGTFGFNVGHTLLYSMDYENHFQYFLHEFSHNLFNSAHYMGANSGAGAHFYQHNGWGMMGAETRSFLTANAWEKWYLGWFEPQTITTSGIYYLKDFVNETDAIRIHIPAVSTLGSNLLLTNQYLWLENHQMTNYFDNKFLYTTEATMQQGIYGCISDNDMKNGVSVHNSNNRFKVLNATGRWDFAKQEISSTPFINANHLIENPIGGQAQSEFIRSDYDANGLIPHIAEGNEGNESRYISKLNNLSKAYWTMTGDDGFRVNDEIGLSGIIPVTCYPYFAEQHDALPPRYGVDPYQISGISIKILEYNSTTKTYKLDIQLNDYEIRSSKRWSASGINLNNLSNNNYPDLIIKSGVELKINKSGTVNRSTKGINNEYPDLIRLTSFTCKADAYIKMETNSTILLDENSTMQMDDNSKLELFPGAQLIINDGSTLRLKNLSQLIVHTGAKVVLQQGSKLVYEQGALITLGQDAFIELQQDAQIEIGANATFTWSGLGYLKINTPTFGVSNMVASGANAKFYKAGTLNPTTGKHDYKHIEVVNGSLSVDKTLAEFKLINCKILLGLGAIVDVDPLCWFAGVKFTTDNPSIKHGGLWVYGQQDLSYANNCTFEYAYTGITVYPAKGVSAYFRIISNTFRNCDYGIAINGKGAIINNCKFWSMGIQAIRLNGIQHESRIVNCTVNDCAMGVFSLGSSTNLVRVVNSNVYQNTSGVYARNSTIAPGCSYVQYNYLGNLMSYHLSNIIIDPITLPHVGYNNLSSNIFNTPSIYLNNSSGVSLNKGHSNFSSTSGSNLAIQGQIVPNFVPTIPPVFGSTVTVYAEQNYWHAPGTMPTASPVQLLSYDVDWQDGFGRKIVLDDNGGNSFTSPPSIGNCNPAPPPGSVTFPGDKPGEFLGKSPKQLCDNTDLEVVFMQATDLLYPIVFDVPPQCLLAFTKFENIAGCPFDVLTYSVDVSGNLVNEFELWHNVLDLSYTRLVESMVQAVANGELNITDPDYITHLTRVQIVQANLLNMSGNNHQMQYRFYTDLAMLYRLGKYYDDALNYISLAAQLENSAEEIELNNYYQCTVTKEKMMEADELSKEDYLSSMEECYTMLNIPMQEAPIPVSEPPVDEEYDPEGENRHTALPKTETSLSKATPTIYPNPSTGVFYVKTSETVLQINVVDMQGKTIATYNSNQPIYITQKGIYTLVITTANNTVTRKVMVK